MSYELEHTRHRCLTSLMIHLLGVLISYSLQVFKPSLRLRKYSTSSPLLTFFLHKTLSRTQVTYVYSSYQTIAQQKQSRIRVVV